MATNKQKALARKIAENPSLPMKTAMLEVGYSENTAIAPRNVTESKAWPDLIAKYLPDDKVLEVHKKALGATKIVTSHTEPDRIVDDIPTQLKAVELAYKVTGKLKDNSVNVQVNNVIPILGEMKAE